jgi:hypothetical protein
MRIKRGFMIPGLNIDENLENSIWSAFDEWADHFKLFLKEKGLPGVINKYETLVDSVENKRCNHGVTKKWKTGKDWQYCCGNFDEYLNDISIRDALETIFSMMPITELVEERKYIENLDARLYALFPRQIDRKGDWWYSEYPQSILRWYQHDGISAQKLCSYILESLKDIVPNDLYVQTNEFINVNNEWGVGLEILIDQLIELDIVISYQQFEIIKAAMSLINISDAPRIKALEGQCQNA